MNFIRRYTTPVFAIAFAASLFTVAQAAPAPSNHTLNRGMSLPRHMAHTSYNRRHFGAAVAGDPASQAICSRLVSPQNPYPQQPRIAASSGAQMYCFGSSGGFNRPQKRPTFLSQALAVGGNVDAANPSEDIAPNGTYAYGQSETSLASIDNNVVEAWNDSTGFFSASCSPSYKDQLTGYGLSTDGGKHFTDLGGLPNPACATSSFNGDPFVEAYKDPATGNDIFYIGSLYGRNSDGTNPYGLLLALDACRVAGSYLTCNGPFVIATNSGNSFNFIDKDFGAIDPANKRLYITYTDFNSAPTFDNIDLTACDISTPMTPVCGSTNTTPASNPNFIASSRSGCAEEEGAYPAVDRVTGDVYVAFEHNWASNLFGCSDPVQERVVQVPFSQCLASLTTPSPCGPASPSGPALVTAVNIASEDSAFIPGYSRFPMNDFPRIAVSDPYGTVSIVWNDTRFRPGGDILLESFQLGTGFPQAIQTGQFPNANPTPTRLTNNPTKPGDFNFLPGLRYSEPDGKLDVTWYDRRYCNQTQPSNTDVYGAFEVDPTTRTTPGNRRVTNVTSNWLNTSSDITPNFGDYTDNYIKQSGSAASGYLAAEDFVAWTDGRTTAPNPFEAYVTGI